MVDDPSDPGNLGKSDLEQRVRDIVHASALVSAWQTVGYDLELVSYEGGQHLVGAGYQTEAHVIPLFQAANDHVRMGAMYRRLLTAWRDYAGETFTHFVHRERWWGGGFFGALAWYDEDETTSPPRYKYQLLLEAMSGDD